MMQCEEKGEAVDLDWCCALMIFLFLTFSHTATEVKFCQETREELGLLLVQLGNKWTKRDGRTLNYVREVEREEKTGFADELGEGSRERPTRSPQTARRMEGWNRGDVIFFVSPGNRSSATE